jgi:biotin operon repressor
MESKIKKLIKYVDDILGFVFEPTQVPKKDLGNLPMYISEMYRIYNASLFNVDFLLIEYNDDDDDDGLSIFQLGKHIDLLKNNLNKKVVFLAENLTSLNRKRLIEKGLNFIVPGKQMYLPDLLIDLREGNHNPRQRKKVEKLLPSAQLILLYHILHRNENKQLADDSFTQLALRFGYSRMAITKAIENLVYNKLCTVEGAREKYIRFIANRDELWQQALPLCVNPVFKKVFVDEKPGGQFLLQSNESALTVFSNMNPSRQKFYAIERVKFYDLLKNGQLTNPNESEGKFCLEVWKYNPLKLADEMLNDAPVVDPLSLYLSLRESYDERVEMALQQIVEKYIW